MKAALAAVGLLAVLTAACGTSGLPTTTISTTVPETTSTTTGGRITLIPNSTPFIVQGSSGAYVEALQFYLVCTGHEEPTPGALVSVDGNFGPITGDAVAYYQAELRRVPSGDPDEETFASLARDCNQPRTMAFAEGLFTGEIAGNASPGDDEVFQFAAAGGQVLTFEIVEGLVTLAVTAADGSEVEATVSGTGVEVELETAQAYGIRVASVSTTSFRITTALRSPNVVVSDFGPMTLDGEGLGIADLGDDPTNTVAVIALVLGQPFDDSGWIEEPGCTGSNRHVTWVIQGGSAGSDHPAFFVADFTDTGGTPYFSQYAYRSDSLTALDPIARGLTTADGLTIGSTFDEFVGVHDTPEFDDTVNGLTVADGVTFGFRIVGSADSPDGAATRIYLVGAGADGCPDF